MNSNSYSISSNSDLLQYYYSHSDSIETNDHCLRYIASAELIVDKQWLLEIIEPLYDFDSWENRAGYRELKLS